MHLTLVWKGNFLMHHDRDGLYTHPHMPFLPFRVPTDTWVPLYMHIDVWSRCILPRHLVCILHPQVLLLCPHLFHILISTFGGGQRERQGSSSFIIFIVSSSCIIEEEVEVKKTISYFMACLHMLLIRKERKNNAVVSLCIETWYWIIQTSYITYNDLS